MNRTMCLMLCATMLMGTLTACGGQQDLTTGADGTVSGGAVSGSAVSGPAVEGKRETRQKFLFCNDTHLYYQIWNDKVEDAEDMILVARRMEDGSEQDIIIPFFGELLYADNEWVYYTKYEEEEDSLFETCICRAPIMKNQQNGNLILEKEETLCEETKGIGRGAKKYVEVFCNGRYIAYFTEEKYEFRLYDITQREYVSFEWEEEIYSLLSVEGVQGALLEGENGMLWLDGETGQIRSIQKPFSEDDSATFLNTRIVGSDVFFLDSYFYNEEDEVSIYNVDVHVYRQPDEENPEGRVETLITDKEVKQLLKREGYLDTTKGKEHECDTVDVFVHGDTLYHQVHIWWKENGVRYWNTVMLRLDMKGKEKLQVDKEFTQILENPVENQKVFEKAWGNAGGISKAFYLSRGVCVGATEEYAYFMLFDGKEDVVLCYEFDTGKKKNISKKDLEWYVPYYNDVNHPAEYVWVNFLPNNMW